MTNEELEIELMERDAEPDLPTCPTCQFARLNTQNKVICCREPKSLVKGDQGWCLLYQFGNHNLVAQRVNKKKDIDFRAESQPWRIVTNGTVTEDYR